MANDETTDPPEGQPENDEGAQAEAKFWEKFDGRLDAFFDRKLKLVRETGSQRGKGRTTVPGIFAEFMFGKPTDKS